MPRPAKWKPPTVAVRVPEQFAEELLAIARRMDEGLPSEGDQRCVQNILEGAVSARTQPASSQRLEIGDRVRIVELAGRNPKWLHAEALIVEVHPRVSIRVWNDELKQYHIFFWPPDCLEEIEPPQRSVQNDPVDEDGLTLVDTDLLDRLVDETLSACDTQGLDPGKLLLRLKLQELRGFLSHYRERDRKEFVIWLMDEVFRSEAA